MNKKYLAVAIAALVFTGCSNIDISKQLQGTAAGAMAGAAVGSQVGGAKGALIGALVGGFIGNQLGSWLDEEDKKKLVEIEAQALQNGKQSTFIASKSKAKVTVTPQEAKYEQVSDKSFFVPADVAKQRIEIASHDDVKAFVDTPVYPDTTVKGAPRLTIKTGESIKVAANVINKEGWGVVADGDNVLGYVPMQYLDRKILKKAPKKLVAKVAKPNQVDTPKVTVDVASVKKSDDTKNTGSVAAVQPATLAALSTNTIQPELVCKINKVRLDPTDGSSPVFEEHKYCLTKPPKGWDVAFIFDTTYAYTEVDG